MQCAIKSKESLLAGFPRFCALLLVVVYAFSTTPLGIGCAALVGKLDQSHQVLVNESGGRISVVLHHAATSAGHVHHKLASLLTIFATTSPGERDHVLSSAVDEFSERIQNFRLPILSERTAESPLVLAFVGKARTDQYFIFTPRDTYLGIRSTVLLL